MRGRKKLSPEERIAKGETRPSQVNYDVPDSAPPESLDPPKDLKGAGLKLWQEHAEKLKAVGQLRASDVPLFTELCHVATKIAEYRKRKDDPGQRMLVQLQSLYLRMSSEMGLSSVSRSKVKSVSKAPVGKPKHDRFFGKNIRVINGGRNPQSSEEDSKVG